MKKFLLGMWLLFGIWYLLFGVFSPCLAQESKDKTATATATALLTKKIMEAKTQEDLYLLFDELKDAYFKDNRYTEFIEAAKSLGKKKKLKDAFINYYIVVSRYYQLKYLEEAQKWEEYFSEGSNYREQIINNLDEVIAASSSGDTLRIYAKLLLWQFHRDQQDAFHEQALADLINTCIEYSKSASFLKVLKDTADKLSVYGEKAKAKQVYKIYADKIISSNINEEELNSTALSFYKESNLALAEDIYDTYIERVKKSKNYPREKTISLLKEIASLFSYKDEGLKDMLYAEKIFKEIESIGGKEALALDEESFYLRAFNLEKAKEYNAAKDAYISLIQRYPNSVHFDEANFKIGLIYTYVLRDIKTGSDYFAKLVQKKIISPQVISSLYQLGLLRQWENDLIKAKEYYNTLINTAGDNFTETVALAKERIKEIDAAKPIEYNLKIFLDVSLKEENVRFEATGVDLVSRPYRPNKDKEINIYSTPYGPASGCMQVELQYLWSGNLGTTRPSLSQSSFNTVYTQPGTKEINLVVVSPAGILNRGMDIVDVY